MEKLQLKKIDTITFQELKIFQLFIKTGSIQKTSEALNVSQPTCTRSISKLEEKLKTILFLRLNNEYQLTEQAIKIYEPLMLIMRNYSNSIERNQQGSKKLRLFMPIVSSYINAKYYIPELKKQVDILDIELITSSMSFFLNHPTFSPHIISNMDVILIRSEYDRYLNPMIWKKVYRQHLTQKLYSSNKYLQKNEPICRPSDLANHTCIISSNSNVNLWTFTDKHKKNITISTLKNLIIDSEALAALAVDAGAGIAILSENLVNGYKRQDMVEF